MHRIVKAEGPERIAPEWWKQLHLFASGCGSAPGDVDGSAPVHSTDGLTVRTVSEKSRIRDYYLLEDDCGALYWVFRCGLYQREAEEGPPTWYMHGLFG